MKMITLAKADRCEIEYMGRWYKMTRGVPVEVPHELADRLIRSGDFFHIVSIDQIVRPGEPIRIEPDKPAKGEAPAEAPAPAQPRRRKAQ